MISSLSLIISDFEGTTISLDMPRFIAIVIDSIILGLALASRISRLLGRASLPVVWLVSQILYYVGINGRLMYE